MAQKNLYIIAGCNGAGKTTAAFKIFPEILESSEFVNADEISRELRVIDPGSSDIQAGRLMLERISELISSGQNFTIETTLASRSLMQIVKKAKELGYQVTLAFFWLNSPLLAVERVRSRVEHGGHNIPPEVIIRRYNIGLKNLFHLYLSLVDFWMMYDNSGIAPVLIAKGSLENYQIKKNSNFTALLKHYSDGSKGKEIE